MSGPRRRVRYPELEKHYELQETLGSGGFAKVKAAIHKLTGEKVAVKIMNKEGLGADLPRVYREIRCLKRLHHQHICQLFEVIETREMIYVVLEFCPGGELFDYIVAKERLKEREARSFFRQILSALKYVHEMGYIHRDLKPENLLLDGESNIKLIDFGLVAEPDDSQDLLATCCGSPAYAAPELIRGGPYIGTRADVWSLGVLLYALLNGFLPFDDDHTPYLYRLIQKGEYEIPEWLSLQSIAIIAQLLQTNPERRITVDRLLRNKWVMTGYNSAVDWRSKVDLSEMDSDCLTELATYYCYSYETMEDEVCKWKYNEMTAAYLLLLQQKLRGKEPRVLLPPKHRVASPTSSVGNTISPLVRGFATKVSSSSSTEGGDRVKEVDEEEGKEGEGEEVYHTPEEEPSRAEDGGQGKDTSTPPPDTPELPPRRRRISLGQPMHPPPGEILSLQKHLEGFLPPELREDPTSSAQDEDSSPSFSNEYLPSESYGQEDEGLSFGNDFLRSGAYGSLPPNSRLKAVGPKRSVPIPYSPSVGFHHEYALRKEPVKKTCSYDAQLNRIIHIGKEKVHEPSTPQPTRRKRFGIPGHLLKKAKKVLTPRSRQSDMPAAPRRVKGVYDVNSTSMKTSDEVIAELERVLNEMGIEYKRKNFVFHCKFNCINAQVDRKRKNVEFDLEVCLLPTIDMIGVRRKRIKGDTWEFKHICGQIFRATHI